MLYTQYFTFSFYYPRDAMRKHGLCYCNVSVRLSVTPGIVYKRLNLP